MEKAGKQERTEGIQRAGQGGTLELFSQVKEKYWKMCATFLLATPDA